MLAFSKELVQGIISLYESIDENSIDFSDFVSNTKTWLRIVERCLESLSKIEKAQVFLFQNTHNTLRKSLRKNLNHGTA